MFLQDTRVIHRHGAYQVLAQRFEVMFRDGSTVQLHPVTHTEAPGACDTFLRAIHHEGLRWIVFDLRHLSAEVEADILRLLPRDTPGVVFYTLRQSFATAAALLVRVQDCAKAVWWQAEIAEAA